MNQTDKAMHPAAALAARETLAVPAQFNFAADVVYRRARATPEAAAVLALDAGGRTERWTYARIALASGRLAAAMSRSGLKQGDRVLIVMARVPWWQVAMVACLHLGLVPVPCVSQASAAELAYRLRRCGARGAIVDSEFIDRFAPLGDALALKVCRGGGAGWIDLEQAAATAAEPPPLARMDAEAPALMYFTSGSSGPPKPVMHAARSVYVRSWQPWHRLGLDERDVIWTSSDTGWTRAASCLLFGAWMHGALSLMVDANLDAAAKLDLLERYGVSLFGAVATELRMLIAAGGERRFPRLRLTISAGEAMTAELARRWSAFSGSPLLVGYGQSETSTATLTDPAEPAVNGMIGRPLRCNHVTVVDDRGRETAPLEHGHLAFAADDPGLMLGYWADDGRAHLDLAHGRWHLTGDCSYRDAAGNLYFIGREDDIISSAGYRIGPTDVENALAQHPAVAECAVVGSPDPVRGEAVKAFVVLRPGYAAGDALAVELQDHCKREIAPYKYPRSIAFAPSLPRTASGKITRKVLREAEFACVHNSRS